MKTYEHTEETLLLFEIWNEADVGKAYVCKRNIFKNYRIYEVVQYLTHVGECNAKFWNSVYRTYPELKGKLVTATKLGIQCGGKESGE